MPPESVVDALRKVHRTLRPGGVLLDIHPITELSRLEVRTSSGVDRLGDLTWSSDFSRTISNAEQSLAALNREGVFLHERAEEFRIMRHFATVAEWQDFMAKETPYYVPLDETLAEAIHQVLSPGNADLTLSEPGRASKFIRSG